MVSLKPSVFLFIGNEDYLKESAIKDLTSSLLPNNSSRDLDYKVFYGGEASAKDILDYATTFPFLDAKKLIVIKNFERLSVDDKSRLVAYIKKPSKFTYLVLDAAEGSALETLDPVIDHIKVLKYDELTNSNFYSWVKRFMASRGKKIEEEAIEILKEFQGKNLLVLAQELEKLSAFVGNRDTVRSDDVKNLVGKSFIGSIFDLAKAIGEKRTEAALKLTSDLTTEGKRAYEIIGLLYWHINRLFRAKSLQSKHKSDSFIGNVLKINKRYLEDFTRQVNSYSIAEIKKKMRILLETDLAIKRTKYDPRIVLEFAILRLALG